MGKAIIVMNTQSVWSLYSSIHAWSSHVHAQKRLRIHDPSTVSVYKVSSLKWPDPVLVQGVNHLQYNRPHPSMSHVRMYVALRCAEFFIRYTIACIANVITLEYIVAICHTRLFCQHT